MTSGPQMMSHVARQQIEDAIEQVKARVDVFGFAVWPLTPDPMHGIPSGFITIGFTKIGLPEFYVSGIPGHHADADALIQKLRELYSYARDTALGITPMDLCMQFNMEQLPNGAASAYQWRPVDSTRLLYGQCTTLRYWAEAVGLLDLVTGIQIVHRPTADADFPMVSTPDQLLLDWPPFGSKPFTPQLKEVVDVPVV